MAPARGTRRAPPAACDAPPWSDPLAVDLSKQYSLWLQVLLYFSFWYDVLFAALLVLAAWVKFRWLKGEIIFAFLGGNFFVVFVLEPCRLYLGYTANLRERVPELFLFVFLCFLCYGAFAAQLVIPSAIEELSPKECSTIEGQSCVLPIEKACWMVRVVLLICEQVLGIRALRRLIKEKSARFFVSLEASVGSAAMDGAVAADDVDITGIIDGPGSTGGIAANRSALDSRSTPQGGAYFTSRGASPSAPGNTSAQVYGRPMEHRDRRPHAD
mmetsp:Transcript_48815/g.145867  ORF Transcript_48815/g.145867 Transcript_48815/m.145867 type:complete len:271 (+) Transcript_48815:67-879(+)